METGESMLFEAKGHIGLITLQCPERLNVLNYNTLCSLDKVVEKIQQNPKEIRTVVITGEGRAFSAGADLKERKTLNEQQVRRNVAKIRDVFTAIERLPQPTIAAINGYAFGGGFELALACDFRFAVHDAVMGLTEVSQGIIPGAGGTQRLTRLVGPSISKELILTARRISAQQAWDYRILNGVATDQKELMEKSFALAEEIANNAPRAVFEAKYAISKGANTDIQTGIDIETKAYEVIIPTKDRLEALAAFEEKRKPIFTGE
ncbi:enoyl-CoA hydratase-related protein [Aneurinibacillus sp. REN35]|uniref:enoyl-CoA hydratase-related protein n=1 Tax=Aneurinibacillus sp. REN35 TaxID=3237286 RepID=UPI0035290280